MEMSHFVPQMYTLNFSETPEWTVKTLQSYRYLEKADYGEYIRQEIEQAQGKNSLKEVRFKGHAFLLAIFPVEKSAFICSPRMNSELFFLEHTADYLSDNNNYQKLKSQVEKVQKLNMRDVPAIIEQTSQEYGLEDYNGDRFKKVDREMTPLVSNLGEIVEEYEKSLFEKITDYGLGLTATFPLIRIHLLKFLAILPSLDHDQLGSEVKRILQESLRRTLEDNESAKEKLDKPIELAFKIVKISSYFVPAPLLAFIVRLSVRFAAKRFIAGETMESSGKSLNALYSSGRDATLDQLGELVVSEKEADTYFERVIHLIEGQEKYIPKGEKNKAGISRAHVSIKISALTCDFNPNCPLWTYQRVVGRLRKILIKAKECEVFINVDAEHYSYRDLCFELLKRVLLETSELKDFSSVGIVVQAYLRDGAGHLEEVIDLAKKRKLTMPIRLVKGAYWDEETIEARAHSYNAPQFLNKVETDLYTRQIIFRVLEASPHLQLCLGSHNINDHCFSETARKIYFPNSLAIEHQCLHMTYEALSVAMQKVGWAVRNYVPIGDLLVGMAYLVRRIMENSSQVGILTQIRSKEFVAKAPSEIFNEIKKSGHLERDLSVTNLTSEFFNCAPIHLFDREERAAYQESLKNYGPQLGKIFKNKNNYGGKEQSVYCGSEPEKLVGKIVQGTAEDATKCVDMAYKAFIDGKWRNVPRGIRSSLLVFAADIMRERRNELSCLISYEASKSVEESYADVDEAIDFLNFYAREEMKFEGEDILPRGVVSVVAPWNFPLAIPCGMSVSALVAGNSVVLKSASQTPLIAQVLTDILHEAGIPPEAFIHLPGPGSGPGSTLVSDDRVNGLVFTGSKKVGMSLAHMLGKKEIIHPLTKEYQPPLVITEMGGKNAIIVTENAEMDETVSGILSSALGHSGQKCSAASRIIVHKSVKEKLVERLTEAFLDVQIGVATDLSTKVNPLVGANEKNRLLNEIDEAKAEASECMGKVIVDRSSEILPGYALGPVLIEIPKKVAFRKDSFFQKELFGPVVHLVEFNNLDEAVKLFNCTEYALTGGIFSQSQDHIDYLLGKLEAGNLYVNRNCTGARVGIEPFGGHKLSGTGPKAGGTRYQRCFHVGRAKETGSQWAVSEKGHGTTWATESPLSSQETLEILVKGLGKLSTEYPLVETMVNEFQSWVINSSLNFKNIWRSNLKIPGQIGKNSLEMNKEKVLALYGEETLSKDVLFSFLAALNSQAGVTVLALNKNSYSLWSRIRDIFLSAGLEGDNLRIYLGSKLEMKTLIQDPSVGPILYDGPQDHRKALAKLCFDEKYNERQMKRFIGPWEGDFYQSIEDYSYPFVEVRSFAINTMRHGAPLTMENE